MSECRFPPPWSVEEYDPKFDRRCFIVRDANGQALSYNTTANDATLPVFYSHGEPWITSLSLKRGGCLE